jgi:carboxyl-terminal processing protease
MTADTKTRRSIVRRIKKLVLAHHVNIAAVDYTEWGRQWDAGVEALLGADAAEFETGVRSLLKGLKSSHTTFYNDQPNKFPSQQTIGATFRRFDSGWMFLDVFEGGPADTAGLKPGDVLEDGGSDPPQFGIGQTYQLPIQRQGQALAVTVTVPLRKGTKERPPMIEPKAVSQRMVVPGTGLLRILHFSGNLGLRFMRDLDRAMDALHGEGCERLIIDLRGNVGGSLGFARLASYLCPGRAEIGYSVTPIRLRNGYTVAELPRVAMPATRLGLITALGRFAFRDKSLMLLTQDLASQPFRNRVVMLVNEWTASAGEMTAAFAKDNRAAVLVGEKTRGTVLGGRNFEVGGGYWLRLSVFGWFTPQGQSIEGFGVTPDIPLPIDEQALAAGDDNQMTRALQIVTSL